MSFLSVTPRILSYGVHIVVLYSNIHKSLILQHKFANSELQIYVKKYTMLSRSK